MKMMMMLALAAPRRARPGSWPHAGVGMLRAGRLGWRRREHRGLRARQHSKSLVFRE